ncbi:MAG TPA: hypothetical protein VE968_09415 [Sphingomicrobium sp.]|nr:hypothetical protein [Sphingomicrobium sp.]
MRRRVLIKARVRSGTQWSDACILNISSRGLMIQSHRAGPEGSLVELHRGDHVIVARVVWRDGSRAGLQSEERLPVEQIMSLSNSGSLRLVASDGALIDRRRRPRPQRTDARSRGRAIEFAGTAVLLVMFALGIGAMALHALAQPLAIAGAALSGH